MIRSRAWWQHLRQVRQARRQPLAELARLNRHMGVRRLMAMHGFMGPAEAEFFLQFLRQEPGITRIAEIGFNAGHSACMFLGARPDITVVSFDIGHQPQCLHAKRFIDETFPGRHTLVIGDSRQTVPWYANQGGGLVDLILIDGGHSESVAAADLRNMRRLAVPEKTVVAMDDLVPWLPWGVGPTLVWNRAIAAGEVVSDFYLENGRVVVETRDENHEKVCGFGRYLP